MQSPDGTSARLRLRSIVGLLPLCAATVIEDGVLACAPQAVQRIQKFVERHPELVEDISLPFKTGVKNRRLLSIVSEDRMRRLLSRMLDPDEFWSPHGIRSISKVYEKEPFHINVAGADYSVKYLPAESDTGMFGGNSNWRGPIWFPINFMILRALHQLYLYYGDDFKIECPTRSGKMRTLLEIAVELSGHLCSLFLQERAAGIGLYSEAGRSSTKILAGAITFRSMSTSMETTEPASAPVTRRDGLASSLVCFS